MTAKNPLNLEEGFHTKQLYFNVGLIKFLHKKIKGFLCQKSNSSIIQNFNLCQNIETVAKLENDIFEKISDIDVIQSTFPHLLNGQSVNYFFSLDFEDKIFFFYTLQNNNFNEINLNLKPIKIINSDNNIIICLDQIDIFSIYSFQEYFLIITNDSLKLFKIETLNEKSLQLSHIEDFKFLSSNVIEHLQIQSHSLINANSSSFIKEFIFQLSDKKLVTLNFDSSSLNNPRFVIVSEKEESENVTSMSSLNGKIFLNRFFQKNVLVYSQNLEVISEYKIFFDNVHQISCFDYEGNILYIHVIFKLVNLKNMSVYLLVILTDTSNY